MKKFLHYYQSPHLKANFFTTALTFLGFIAVSYAENRDVVIANAEVNYSLVETQNQISGRVADANGQPIPGVNVIEKGTNNGTTTNFDGNYSLNITSDDATLVFSYIGFEKVEIAVAGKKLVNATLSESVESLDEILVIGYGTVKKEDATGSVSSISASELRETPISSLDQGLQGRSAGVQVMQQSHQPGGGVSIRIRGGNSITAGNEPLYVIDGFPIYSDNNDFNAGSGPEVGAAPNALSSINPNDIESIEILKDASATAIYGSRGANGVVIITTKRGKLGKVSVEYDTFYSQQNVSKKIDLLNASQWLTIVNEARANSGEDPIFLEDPYTSDTDWQDEVYQTGSIKSHQLTITGGNENTRYAFSGAYFDQDGIITNSNFQRGNVRLNLDQKINDKIKVGNSLIVTRAFNSNVMTDIYGGARGGIPTNALLMPPVVPVRYQNGEIIFRPNDLQGAREGLTNPVGLATVQTNELTTNRVLGNIFAEVELLDNLILKVSGGVDYLNSTRDFFSPQILPFSTGLNRANIYNTEKYTWLNENTLSYNLRINDDNRLDFLAGFTQQTQFRETLRLEGSGLPSDALGVDALQTAQTQRINSGKSRWDLLSWLGRVNYNLMDKYLFTFSIRADGSSRFGENNKWGIFPSGAFAWKIGNEQFMEDSNVFSDLKLRASYGITGNQQIRPYASLSQLLAEESVLNDQLLTGIFTAGPPYKDLSWEKTSQFDVGLDMSLFEDRINLTADYYYKYTKDLLINFPLPYTGGISSILRNLGELSNRGFEFSLNSQNIKGDFNWETTANISFNTNRVEKLPGLEDGFDAGASDPHIQFGTAGRVEVGEPLGNFYGYLTDGIWQLDELDEATAFGTEPGEVKYLDLNNDGAINAEDRTVIGNAQPDYFFGITNRFSYKRLDLNIFINGMIGFDVLNYQIFEGERLNGATNHFAYVWDRWTPENPSNTVPKANLERTYRLSDRQVEDGSFIRLQNVSLGYNFDTSNVAWLDKAKVYVSGQNLAIITDYRGYDPEVNSFGQNNSLNLGVDRGSYPASRSFTLGLNLSF